MFKQVTHYLRGTNRIFHGDQVIVDWLVTMLGTEMLEDWLGDEQAGNTMPKNFEEFKGWPLDLIENPQRRELNAMKNFLSAKQRDQTDRKFETFLERLHQSMSPPLPEETFVQACISKLREDWSIALHNLCPA